MISFRVKITLIRVFLSLMLVSVLFYAINTRIDLWPNSLIVNTTSADNGYLTELYLNEGMSSEGIVLSSGEPSSAYNQDLKSLSIHFLRRPYFFEKDFSLDHYIFKNCQEKTFWSSRIPRYKYNAKNTKFIIINTNEKNNVYQLYVNDIPWSLSKINGILIAENPGFEVKQPGTIKIIKTIAAVTNNKNIDDLTPGIESLAVITENSAPIGVESVSLKKYFGRLNFFFPASIKIWKSGDILNDFNIIDVSGNYLIENGVLYIDSSAPQIKLNYKHSLNKLFEEIDQVVSFYNKLLYLLVISFAIILFYLSGLLFNNTKFMKTHLSNFIKSSLSSVNTKMSILFIFSLLLLMFASASGLKALFFLLSLLSGASILYYNRNRLEQTNDISSIRKRNFILLAMIIAMIIGTLIFSYKLGEHDLREDEFQVVGAATDYLYFGKTDYQRAYPHSFLIAQSYRIFGISEWSSRIVSLLFGILFIPVFFIISSFFTENKYLAFLSVYIALFYDSYIFIFRYTRMYALVVPLFLILIYLIYRGLTEKSLIKSSSNQLFALFQSNFNYNYYYLSLALLILYLNYLIHINTLIILPAVLCFIFIMLFLTKEKQYLNTAFLGLTGLFVISLVYYFESMTKDIGYISFFERRNFDYLEYLAGYPFHWEIGSVLLALGLFITIIVKGKLKYKLSYLYTITIFSLIFFIFIGDRYSHFLYISHVTPISILLILFTCFMLLRAIDNKYVAIVFTLIVFLSTGAHFYNSIDNHYANSHPYGSFSKAYEIIIDNCDPKKEVIFGQYLRGFYLQKLVQKDIETINMKNNQNYSFDTFLADLHKYEAGWITWETRKSYHLESNIIEFINANFEKLHGSGVDESKVEVYYYEREMLQK